MSSHKLNVESSRDSMRPGGEFMSFDMSYKPADDVHPLDLIGNAHLALHHHMAPADGAFDLDAEDDD